MLNIFASFNNQDPIEIAKQYQDSGYGKFKSELAELVVSKLEPISKKINQLLEDQVELEKILIDGRNHAFEIAKKTRDQVYQHFGLGIN